MRGVLLENGPRLTELPDPTPQEGHVVVRVLMSAITGLDRDVIAGRRPFRGTPGSCFVGVVEHAAGRRARQLVGKRVVARGSYGCGDCESCRMGAEERCSDRVSPGLWGVSGGHAERVTLPDRAVLAVPETVSDEAATLLPLLAGIYAGIARSEMPGWTNVLVVGDGGTGLLAALAFASAGYTVTVRGKHGNRFDLLRRHNIHFNLVTDESEVHGRRPGRFGPALVSYPYIVEASGHSSGWNAALELVSPGGVVFMLSSCHDGMPRPLALAQEKNVRVFGLREGPLEATLAILAQGFFDPTDLTTTVYAFDEVLEAYRRAEREADWIPLLRISQ